MWGCGDNCGGGGGMRSWLPKMAQFSKILIMTLYPIFYLFPPFFLTFWFKDFRILISLIELKKCFQKKFSGNIFILSQTEAGTFNSIHEINKTNYHTRHVKPILALKIIIYAITENNSNFRGFEPFTSFSSEILSSVGNVMLQK